MKRALSVLLLLPLLLSCSNTGTSYKRFYGNETVLENGPAFSALDGKSVLQNSFTSEIEESYCYTSFLASSDSDWQSFYSTNGFSPSEEDRASLSLKEGEQEMLFFVQIPQGSLAFKRNPIQTKEPGKTERLATSSFYTYQSRPTMSFLFVDVLPREEVTSPYVFSFSVKIFSDMQEILSKTSLRLILSDHEATTDEIPQKLKTSEELEGEK